MYIYLILSILFSKAFFIYCIFREYIYIYVGKFKESQNIFFIIFFYLGVMLLKFPDSDLTEALNAVRNWLRNAAGCKQN